MSQSFSLDQLSRYLAGNTDQIAALRKEVEEIQIGFNSAYVEFRAEHDATLERLTETLAGRRDELGPDLRARVDERIVEERRLIAERRRELRDTLIPQAQAEADRAQAAGQALLETLRRLHPRLDEREETLKGQRAELEQELAQLNDQIRRLSGCLGVMIYFLRINRLDRQRQRIIGRLEALQQQLREVRREWQAAHRQMEEQQQDLQAEWQERTLAAAQRQAELEYLDDEAGRETLALRRAVRHLLDHLEEPLACGIAAVQEEVDTMVELNARTDDYQRGLGVVSGMIALLDGLAEGLARFKESVQGLVEEQQMHGAHLPQLSIAVPDEVLDFHRQWKGLRRRVRDDRRLGAHPSEFVSIVQPVMQGDLNEAGITAMFDGLGRALAQATDGWKG